MFLLLSTKCSLVSGKLENYGILSQFFSLFLSRIIDFLTANPKRARLFHEKSLASEDTYEPFLS